MCYGAVCVRTRIPDFVILQSVCLLTVCVCVSVCDCRTCLNLSLKWNCSIVVFLFILSAKSDVLFPSVGGVGRVSWSIPHQTSEHFPWTSQSRPRKGGRGAWGEDLTQWPCSSSVLNVLLSTSPHFDLCLTAVWFKDFNWVYIKDFPDVKTKRIC